MPVVSASICASDGTVNSGKNQHQLAELDLTCAERNARRATIAWQFNTYQARIKLKKLYQVVKI
jgi:hypothetical protein